MTRVSKDASTIADAQPTELTNRGSTCKINVSLTKIDPLSNMSSLKVDLPGILIHIAHPLFFSECFSSLAKAAVSMNVHWIAENPEGEVQSVERKLHPREGASSPFTPRIQLALCQFNVKMAALVSY